MDYRDPRERDRRYLGWVARLPCVACMVRGKINREVQVAHLRAGSEAHGKRPTGGAEKPSDRWTLPLCQPHHTGDRRKVDLTQHNMNELEFWEALGIDPFGLCLALRSAYEAGTPGIAVISAAAGAARRSLEGAPMDEEQALAHYADLQRRGQLPTVALSIQQPWAWLMTRPINGKVKTIENRTWKRKVPPRVLVHAGLKVDADCHEALMAGVHPVTHEPWYDGRREYQRDLSLGRVPKGGFVGALDLTGEVLTESTDPWFMGPYGYVAANPQVLPFLRWRGMLGFFDATVAS